MIMCMQNFVLIGLFVLRAVTLLQICRNSNSSKLSCMSYVTSKNEEDQIENEGARLFTRFLPL